MKEESRRYDYLGRGLNVLWAPIIAMLDGILGTPVPGPANDATIIDAGVDVDVRMRNSEDPDWERGSGVDSEAEEATSAIPAV
jgi:hypothetical protein